MPFQAKRIAITEPYHVILEDFTLDEGELGPQEIRLKTLYSIISAGTEGASYSGLEREHPRPDGAEFRYPVYPGYGNIGVIEEVGKAVKGFAAGDLVFTTARHASHARFNSQGVCVKVPDGLDLEKAVFARMAAVAITSARKADYSVGDTVLVIGMGLVGNFAAQEFLLAGADVMAVDVSEPRLEKARQCGILRTTNPQKVDLKAAVDEWTGGKGARIVVEAIGSPPLIAQAVQLTRRHGEVILLGSPRQRVTMDVTPMLTRIHLLGIQMKGALEWLYSVPEMDAVRHSVVGNVKQILRWLQEDRLKMEPLLTHLLSPADCQQAYHGLDQHKDEYLGVVFDWARLSQ